jgi:hypothetical protein
MKISKEVEMTEPDQGQKADPSSKNISGLGMEIMEAQVSSLAGGMLEIQVHLKSFSNTPK